MKFSKVLVFLLLFSAGPAFADGAETSTGVKVYSAIGAVAGVTSVAALAYRQKSLHGPQFSMTPVGVPRPISAVQAEFIAENLKRGDVVMIVEEWGEDASARYWIEVNQNRIAALEEERAVLKDSVKLAAIEQKIQFLELQNQRLAAFSETAPKVNLTHELPITSSAGATAIHSELVAIRRAGNRATLTVAVNQNTAKRFESIAWLGAGFSVLGVAGALYEFYLGPD